MDGLLFHPCLYVRRPTQNSKTESSVTFTGHLVKYALQTRWNQLLLQSCSNSFACSCWRNSIKQLLQVCLLHIKSRPSCFTTDLLLGWELVTVGPWEDNKLSVVFKKPGGDDSSFERARYPARSSLRKMVHCFLHGTDTVRNKTLEGSGIKTVLGNKVAKVWQENTEV